MWRRGIRRNIPIWDRSPQSDHLGPSNIIGIVLHSPVSMSSYFPCSTWVGNMSCTYDPSFYCSFLFLDRRFRNKRSLFYLCSSHLSCTRITYAFPHFQEKVPWLTWKQRMIATFFFFCPWASMTGDLFEFWLLILIYFSLVQTPQMYHLYPK